VNLPLAPAAHDRASGTGSDAVADPRDCWSLLAALQMLRAHLWLGRVGECSLGLSVIIAIEAGNASFLIDALRDPDDLVPGTGLYFDTQVEGRRLRFECTLIEVVDLDGGPAYRAADPRLVLDQQRRNAYRVRVPETLRLPAALASGLQRAPARMLDLSTRGCSTRVESPLSVARGETLQLHFKLGEFDLACPATVRHIQRLAGAARIGMEFDLAEKSEAPSLDQAVARLQREILRRRQS
jgi:hypothetical protein